MQKRRFLAVGFGIAVITAMVMAFVLRRPEPVYASLAEANSDAPKPVEPDMHEFMEYVFQPTYKRLKAALAEKPADRAAWGTVKSSALILAEGGNLLLFRKPKKETQDWIGHAVSVRTFGGKLYRSAKQRDYAASRQHYEAMLSNCNRCHQQFAGGEHQLKP